MTPEARQAFLRADVALYLVADVVAQSWITELNPQARSLEHHYRTGVPRQEIYDAMTEAIVHEVRSGADVCAAFYGHPGVFVYPSHAAIEKARSEGYRAQMLPAISAEDCLFADLGVDPGTVGCQSYEATDFLLRRRSIDPTAVLILWQIAAVGERIYSKELRSQGLLVLVDYLSKWYGVDHEVTVYEASPYPVVDSMIRTIRLSDLTDSDPSALSTLYVPPLEERSRDPEMMERLGLKSD